MAGFRWVGKSEPAAVGVLEPRSTLGRRITVVAALVALLGGCTAQAAPAPTPSTRTITLAHIDDGMLDPASGYFVREVATRSGGALTVKLAGECCGRGTDRTKRLVQGVASGKWGLGWAGTTELVDLGATSLGPLTAPGLIDSYATEAAVLASPVPAGMLAGVDAFRVRGIAVDQALWPRTSVLIASPSLKLSTREAGWVRAAAAAVAARTKDVAAFDAGTVADSCPQGITFARSTAAQRSAMDAAFAPVIAGLPGGSTTQQAVAAIRALRVTPFPSEYEIPTACLAK